MKRVLITGGSSGLGKSLVKKGELLDYEVLASFKENSASKVSKRARFFELELREKDSINNFLESVRPNLGDGLDLIVLNAATTRFHDSSLGMLDVDTFEELIIGNLVGNYRLAYSLVNLVKPGGSMIFISSVASKTGVGSNIAYTISKSAFSLLAKEMCFLRNGELRINVVAPGLMRTRLTESFPEDYFQKYIDSTGFGRLVTPDEVADVVYSLAENLTGVNGETIYVDGGIR